jgi:hypothetical protein
VPGCGAKDPAPALNGAGSARDYARLNAACYHQVHVHPRGRWA